MPKKLTRAFSLVRELPALGKLGYCLYGDPRVPLAPKVVLAGALGLIVSPLNLPLWIPVVGDLDAIALAILALRVFVEACPQELVKEHRAAIKAGESVFDRDFRAARGAVSEGAISAWARIQGRMRKKSRGGAIRVVEDQSA
jgi:uncharacterized membrane protein YkvA (DUF1232 family)